ncbi:galactose-3-O-sulfotransferase 2-like [Pecten maximus]|uniref:galactose-3-O-sulfotransferase 2-like n=1 Tax=Pecten maximus TaxID=6579 RepID=UPI00145905F9|nr:galactose-3-O-sulfotransferase 2-like [Pecten maximus]XP_033742135.1 galactose-3-O-sulfotransferase 2-like [Pecten maximus]XP_033742136.1 galactose-3-O-sulfotransferase 2-like [Pecten maximus]
MRRNKTVAMSPTRAMYFLCVMICTSVFLYLGVSMDTFTQRRLVSALLVNSSSGPLFRPFPPHLRIVDGIQDSVHLSTTAVTHTVHQNYSHAVSVGFRGKKQTNAAFLKVHKAGSTTIMNIFLRFGVANKLNIVLPNKEDGFGFNYLGYGKTVDRNTIVPVPHNETYNILCNHVVYNRHAFRNIMPVDTVYVGIVREPVSHFLSASVYYRFIHMIQKASGLSNQSSPTEVIHEYFTHQNKYRNIRTIFVRNRMSYDFGLPPSRFDNNHFVEHFIHDLASDFKLVMVMEYFPESLVLLRRYLGWGLEDILYVPLNINVGKSRKYDSLFPADISKLKQWNNADFRLYGFFKRRFLAQVEAEGPSFHKEVQHFKNVQLYVQKFCSKFRRDNQLTIHASEWNDEFSLLADHCRIMTMSEIPLLKMLIQHAKHKYRKSKVRTETLSEDTRLKNSVVEHPRSTNKPQRKQQWDLHKRIPQNKQNIEMYEKVRSQILQIVQKSQSQQNLVPPKTQ